MEKNEINGKELEEINEYSYLGSIVTGGGGADEDVTSRIKKPNVAFVQLYRIWKNKNIRIKNKLKIFNSNVKAVLLYGCETWKVTNSITQKLQFFINRCLRRILNVRWPDVISNIMLWETTGETPVELQIKKQKRKWIGHIIIFNLQSTYSNWGTIKHGIPLVSILGSLLFLIYIYDLPPILNTSSVSTIFADGTSAIISCKNLDDFCIISKFSLK
jgi:hypothetical protein